LHAKKIKKFIICFSFPNSTWYFPTTVLIITPSNLTFLNFPFMLHSGLHLQHQLLDQSQKNLAVILDNPQKSKELATMLLKIADNCTSNLTVQQYVFTRVEEILGLGIDYNDADFDVFGPKVSSRELVIIL
jgi:hypothetical protein